MAWYKTGTIAVSGTTVTGTGTNWLDNKMGIGPGQALLIPGSGTVKMYEVLRVDSATQLTLTSDAGSLAAGQAYAIMSFYADSVPDFARRLSTQLSYYQSQMDGWQQIMTGTGSVTLQAPDGTQVTISSFKKLTADMAGKASSTDPRLDTIDGKRGGALASQDQLIVQSTPTDNSQGAVAYTPEIRGRINGRGGYIDPKGIIWSAGLKDTIGGTAFLYLQISGYAQTKAWTFDIITGNATAPGSWVPNSDSRLKDKITKVTDPLRAMRMMNGYTWTRMDNGQWGIGFIAQEVAKAFPEAVHEGEDRKMPDGTVVEKVLSPDTYGVAAALHHEAILALMEKIDNLETKIEQLTDEKNQQDAQSS